MKRKARVAAMSSGAGSSPSSKLIAVGTPMTMVGAKSRSQPKNRERENRRASRMVAPTRSAGFRHSMCDDAQLSERNSSIRSAPVSCHILMDWSAIQ
jgi:hypothetical protein